LVHKILLSSRKQMPIANLKNEGLIHQPSPFGEGLRSAGLSVLGFRQRA
jgi:hypothetical protein